MDTLGEKCVHNTVIKRGRHETSRHTDYTLTFHHHPEVDVVGISEHTCEEQDGDIVSVNQDRMTSSAEDTSRHTDYTFTFHHHPGGELRISIIHGLGDLLSRRRNIGAHMCEKTRWGDIVSVNQSW